jgi:hypothetical protein
LLQYEYQQVSAAAHSSSNGDDSSCPPKEGDFFMYEGNDEDSAISLSDNDPSGGSKSSSQASLSSASCNFDVSSPADSNEDDDADSDTSLDGYEFYDEKTFPSGVDDDVVHVELADLCRRIKAPLFAYNKILRWAQNAKGQGYSFPIEVPQYSTFISTLKKRLNIEEYVHKTATVEVTGGGTVSFPVFNFRSMFLSLIG